MVTTAEADPGDLLDRAGELLRARGERMTAPRRAVLLALAQRGGHVTAEEVVADLAAGGGAHRSSVYRTLEALTHAGVVQHVHLAHGGTVYHPVATTHPHGQCARCGAVVDLPVALAGEVDALVRERSGFALDVAHVALPGTCAACAAGAAQD